MAPGDDTGTPELVVLRNRAEFLAAARARRQSRPGFGLQARQRMDSEPVPAGQIRVGYTCSKKVGNSVARNRAKRRLREAARAELPRHGLAGWDYVLIGRAGETATRDFALLRADLAAAIAAIHKPSSPRSGDWPRKPR